MYQCTIKNVITTIQKNSGYCEGNKRRDIILKDTPKSAAKKVTLN